jgi:hypothetical protein
MFKHPPKISGYDVTTVEGCRAAYAALRFYAVRVSYSCPYDTAEKFDAAVAAKLSGKADPSPQDFVNAARRVTWPCKRCAGTGQFITGSLNGRPVGPGGICFRCGGKGHQTPEDSHRNYWSDVKRPVYC